MQHTFLLLPGGKPSPEIRCATAWMGVRLRVRSFLHMCIRLPRNDGTTNGICAFYMYMFTLANKVKHVTITQTCRAKVFYQIFLIIIDVDLHDYKAICIKCICSTIYLHLCSFQTLSQTSLLVFVAYCMFNLTCFGRIFDQRYACIVPLHKCY